ncbi:hypothetical protein ACWT_8237 [Actinoplanes sp. SE50]|uniref:hypothetical protein n=1 Tax=unclassified Actinoplanes TaxID=2626549 RepID=UPI00023EDE1A|nr:MULTISPECIES: hypothetical protein [unclassified Actinoplanes]AEV89246.1 hypothetical protein ACPL_8370 [Actinoplanes sp. SE50/110]ATO87652.1 hypothetical protein ACWT_8237 [Actinoplanes sp. SE50]SLM05071.1 hypothetical protein ACSP50_8387 [Actinoplanes sp. SE50/110]
MTGADFHGVDIDLLADFVGGALDGTPDADRVAALLAADPAWQEAYELLAPEMATVGALLTGLPAEPMPVDVVARLDAALAEATVGTGFNLTDTTGSANATPVDHATTADSTPADFTTTESATVEGTVADRSTTTDSAIADRITADRRTSVDSTTTDRAGEADATTASSPTPVSGAPRVEGSGEAGGATDVHKSVVDLDERRRRGAKRWLRIAAPIGVAAGAVAFFGYTAGQQHSESDSAASKAAAGAADAMSPEGAPAVLTSGLDYSLATLGQLPKRAIEPVEPHSDSGLASGLPGGGAIGASAGPSDRASTDAAANGPAAGDRWLGELARLRAPQALQDCLDAIARENGGGWLTAESLDYARFNGKSALVVRFSAANGQWAWASGVNCGLPGGGADTLGSVPVR